MRQTVQSTKAGAHGLQGLGIALVAAQRAQVPVTLVDSSQASIDKGMKFAGTLPSLGLRISHISYYILQISC
jgi:3-hydroxyacyl-CoA dehydrogenase